MDVVDQKLLQLLRVDARRSISDLALELGVARATVRARLSKLEKNRFILGYSVITHADMDSDPIRGIAMIAVDRHNAERIASQLSGWPEVQAIHTTNGRFDLILELGVQTIIEFDDILRRIRLIPNIIASETHLLLTTQRAKTL
ncbi:Lrp/AsnC family transcriptional regulator [Bartonella sp. DGB2]|uniref:Lrp/AsnC family transcriptional regulator n=1 Tax=Bartonella sp. DGB2 TaxID=3388426 RepID=UPI00398FB95C